VTGILGSPICISVYAAISGEFNVGWHKEGSLG
jgi:hypothetical protein